jgi:hypothetical protein
MSVSDFVFEVMMDEWPEWIGNQLYSTRELAEYFGIDDFEHTFYDRYYADFPDAEAPGEFKWEFISKGYYHLYEDGNPTGVSMRCRFVHSSGGKS